ncbi:MAG: HEAT repeat domain-containing protein [Planctomycetota bacterium]|nr:HEAT repeat domain-containing protein [Planctomycetota bacterium]
MSQRTLLALGIFFFVAALPAYGQSGPASQPSSKPSSRPVKRSFKARNKNYQSKTVEQWTKDLGNADRKTRRTAIVSLGDYRSKAGKAVESLLPFLAAKDSVLQEETITSLRLIGKASVPGLILVFKEKDKGKRFAAALTLFTMRGQAEDAVPALCEVLAKDQYSAARAMAASALGKIARKTEISVPALVKALRDKDRGVKRNAGDALAELGPAAKNAVGDLSKMLKDKDVSLRKTAATALGRMGATAKDAVPALCECLATDSDWLVRLNAAEALGFIGDKRAEAALKKALKDKRSAVQAVAKDALAELKRKR